MKLEILYRDDNLAVVVKPAGMPSQPDKTGDEDLCTALEREFDRQVYPVHRLDRPVGGVMVYGLDKKAAAILSAAVARNGMEKRYLAVVTGVMAEEYGRLRDFLKHDQRKNVSLVVGEKVQGAKEARLEYQVLRVAEFPQGEGLTLLEVRLQTGRHHQIRVQLAHSGHPLWGDQKYNPAFAGQRGVFPALWAYRLRFAHPMTKEAMEFEALPEAEPFCGTQWSKILKGFTL